MAKSPSKSKAVEAAGDTKKDVVQAAGADGFEEYAGAGLDNVGADDLLIPRLGILQGLSPQLKKSKSEYIPGAEEGMIADLGTGELFEDGLWFLPVHYRKDYLEWAPRDSGKGLIEVHSSPDILDQCTKDERGRMVLPSGNYIAETAQFYGINLTAGGRLSFLPMTSTQLKKARRWNTLATGEKLRRSNGSEFTAPLFYRTYILGSAEESNNEGDWFGWTLARGKALPELDRDLDGFDWRELKETAVSFLDSLVKGQVRGDVSDLDGGASSPADDAAM